MRIPSALMQVSCISLAGWEPSPPRSAEPEKTLNELRRTKEEDLTDDMVSRRGRTPQPAWVHC